MEEYVKFFRHTSPYINMHRGSTFVIAFSGEAVAHDNFSHIIHDIALLNSLGIRIVLVHGARPQIEERLKQAGIEAAFHNHQRISDEATMACVKEAIGATRIAVESQLSMGLANSPMHGSRLRVVGGNFINARPVGVRDGVDFHYTGEVRKVDATGIGKQLDQNSVVLLSSLGYSLTGEAFNLTYQEVAQETAVALKAEKLIYFLEDGGIRNGDGELVRLLSVGDADRLLDAQPAGSPEAISLGQAVAACRRGVQRGHLISYRKDGALLEELFTHDGGGTLVLQSGREIIRPATIDDVPGLLEIIAPLEETGVLVKRSRELLEQEISRFHIVVDAENLVVACMALYPFASGASAELACVATHADYTGRGFAARLLNHVEQVARGQGLSELFVLTTRTAHWFIEHGFTPSSFDQLPAEKRELYNYHRNSKIFRKTL